MLFSGGAGVRYLFLAMLLCGWAGLPLGAQNPPKKDKEPAKTGAFRMPSGAIVIVTGNPDAFDKPDAIYLSPEKYKELSDQIEQLKKQLAAEKAIAPSSCELEGRIEQRGAQAVARIRATFKFRTTMPKSLVFLGCQKAQPIEAKLEDGKLPLLASSEKGLTVQADSAGEHTVSLQLELPLLPRGPKGGEIGFELGLPGAPITTLTFEAPAKVKRLTVSRREIGSQIPTSIPEPPLDVNRFDAERLAPGRGGEALGCATFLAVSWEDTAQTGVAENARSAEADVQVTIGEADILAETRLRLRGSAKEWKLHAPHNAEVSVGRAPVLGTSVKPSDFPPDQAPEVVRPEPGKSDWRIRFREVNSTELLAVITTRSPRNREPKAKTIWPVGPFAVLDLPQQAGTIRVKSLPHIRATAILKGDTQRIDASDDPGSEAIYRYRTLPAGANNLPGPPMELDIRTLAGAVQTRVHHFLTLGEGGWRLRSEILVTPIRSEIETLDLEVPVPGMFEASTPKLVEGIVSLRDNGPQRRIIQIKLAAPQRAEFALGLEGFYPLAISAQEATLVLPRLLHVFDRSGQVTVTIPEGFDLHGTAYQWENDKPGTRIHPLEPPANQERSSTVSAGVSQAMSHVELVWKPHRADVRVDNQIDLVLGDKQGQIHQRMHYTFPDRPQRKLRLRGPATVVGIAVAPGSVEINGPGDWTVSLPADPGREATIDLAYSFTLPPLGDDSLTFTVPLLWPETATTCENRVRVLRDRAALNHPLPALEAGSWQELPAEILGKEPALSLLVLRGSGVNLPLTLALRDGGAGIPSMPAIWIDRALIQAQSGDAGQPYRARFHLTKWLARTLDLELPGGAADVEVRIDGIRSDLRYATNEGESGRLLRVPLPEWREPKQLLLEVKYLIPGGIGEGIGSWMVRWQPPKMRGRVAIAAVRWQVAIPDRTMPLSIGDAIFEERWTVRNGFAHPVAAHATSDLEKWLASGREPDGSDVPAGWEMADAGVTARQAGLAPFRIVAIPRTVWLFAVSLIVLVVGLLLARLPSRTVGVSLALLAALGAIFSFPAPQPAGQVLAAAQPGLLILLLILGMQRLLQWRYRRRLARMPGFSRRHSESALSRTNGQRIIRETSTVDSPAEMGS